MDNHRQQRYELPRDRSKLSRPLDIPVSTMNSQRTHARRSVWAARLQRITPLVLVLFVVLVFARTLQFGLYLDDNHHARPWALREVLGTFVGPFDPLGIEPPYFRPLVVVTFAIDWVIWGWNAWGYHLTNVLFHALASVLVYVFLRRIDVAWLAAVVGAAFFAIVPANAATAIYVSERSDAMVAIFSLCGLLFLGRYHRDGKRRWLVVFIVMVVFAVASKEIGVALPLLAIMVWIYFTVSGTSLVRYFAVKPRSVWTFLLSVARSSFRFLVGTEQGKRLVLVTASSLLTLICYIAYRALVLPTGVLGASYSATKGPLRGFASAIVWTFKAVPWEVSTFMLPLLATTIGLALCLRPRSPHWRIVLLGFGWVAIGCCPLAYLGQVEPRLLYLPEVGHSIVVAGLACILENVVRSHVERQTPWHLAVNVLIVILAIAFFGTTAASLVRSQNEFQPFGYKMLRADYDVYTDERHRHLYPAYRIEQIEQKLRQSNMLP